SHPAAERRRRTAEQADRCARPAGGHRRGDDARAQPPPCRAARPPCRARPRCVLAASLPRPGALAAARAEPPGHGPGDRTGTGGGTGMSPPRLGIGVIGAGRAGAVLCAARRVWGPALPGASAVSAASRGRAAELLPGVPLLDLPSLAERSEMLLLAVPAAQLAPLAAGIAATGMA